MVPTPPLPTEPQLATLGRRERVTFALRCSRHALALLHQPEEPAAQTARHACAAALARVEAALAAGLGDPPALETARAELESGLRAARTRLTRPELDGVESAAATLDSALFASRAQAAGPPDDPDPRAQAAARACDHASADAAHTAADALLTLSRGGHATAALIRTFFEAAARGRIRAG